MVCSKYYIAIRRGVVIWGETISRDRTSASHETRSKIVATIDWPEVDAERIGPARGTRFPDVILPNQDGVLIDLHQTRGHRRALVMFQRSARW